MSDILIKNKILLVALNGSYTHTNLAVRCLRRSLEKEEFEVVIKEFNLRERNAHILDEIIKTNAYFVGFSSYIWNITEMLSLASDLKKIRPDTKIIFGGPEVSYDTERFDNCGFIDAIICGEGEEVLPRLCKNIKNGVKFERLTHGKSSSDVMKNEGILYKEEDFNGKSMPVDAMLYYESSRGCPFSCAYCLSSAECGVRAKSAEQTLNDLREFEKFRVEGRDNPFKIIKFVDRTFNFNQKRANDIWKGLLSEEFTKHYHFEICASLLDDDSFEILSKFPKGKIQLECGLQSTFVPTLEAVSRHINPEKVLENVQKVYEMGNIHIHLDLIAGLPYENLSRFKKSFDDAYFCCDLLQLGFLKLLHGTSIRRDAEKYGMVFSDDPPYTVLKTSWMSYEDLAFLAEIDEILERFRESGKFKKCIDFLLGIYPSPFEFYEGLLLYIQNNDGRYLQKISQIDAFGLLYGYGKSIIKMVSKDDPVTGESLLKNFENAVHEDYSASETRKMPKKVMKTD